MGGLNDLSGAAELVELRRDLTNLIASIDELLQRQERNTSEIRGDLLLGSPEQRDRSRSQLTEKGARMSSGALAETVARREAEMEALLQELKRVLPATYFRSNSRVKRVWEALRGLLVSNLDDVYLLRAELQRSQITHTDTTAMVALLAQTENRLRELLAVFPRV